MGDKLIILGISLIIIAFIMVCIVKTEKWARESNQPTLRDLLKGSILETKVNCFRINKPIPLFANASIIFTMLGLLAINSGKNPCDVTEIRDTGNKEFSIEIDREEV